MSKAPLIATYKGIQIRYNTNNGYLFFNFEGVDIETHYLFEAEKIIDNPRWEECDLKGFYLDYSLDYYIGKAIAKKRDTKTGRPYWMYKGRYDMDYKRQQSWREDNTQVYPVNEETIQIYKEWEAQRTIANNEQYKTNQIAKKLKEMETVK